MKRSPDQRETISPNIHWDTDTLRHKFIDQQEHGKGIESYSLLPSSIETSDWFDLYDEIFHVTEKDRVEPAILMRATQAGFKEIFYIEGNDHQVNLSTVQNDLERSSIVFHGHVRPWSELSHERYRDAIKRTQPQDHLSATDRIKILLGEQSWACLGVVHGRSVTFLLRSNETPMVFDGNRLIIEYLKTFLTGDLVGYFYEKFLNINMDFEITKEKLAKFQGDVVKRFAHETRSGLYQVANYLQSTTAVRID